MKYSNPVIFLLTLSLFFIPGCEVIGEIFKAGVWVGIIIVIAIIAVIAFIARTFKD